MIVNPSIAPSVADHGGQLELVVEHRVSAGLGTSSPSRYTAAGLEK